MVEEGVPCECPASVRGGMLDIKPIIRLEEACLDPIEKMRGRNRH